MSKATLIPAVTETKTVEVEPAKVVLELTPNEAGVLKTLIGATSGNTLYPLYSALAGLVGDGLIPCKGYLELLGPINDDKFVGETYTQTAFNR